MDHSNMQWLSLFHRILSTQIRDIDLLYSFDPGATSVLKYSCGSSHICLYSVTTHINLSKTSCNQTLDDGSWEHDEVDRIEEMVLEVKVSSYTVGEDSQALVDAKVSIKVEHNIHHDTDEEGMQATSSMGCDNSQGDGRTNLVDEDDNINDVASKVIMYDNIDLEASNYCAQRDDNELYDLHHFNNLITLNMVVCHQD